MLRKTTKRLLAALRLNTYQPLNRIELNRARALDNLALIQKQHPGFAVIPVLKGNAYGHGLPQMAEIMSSMPTGLSESVRH